jgi:hypothetical protein
MCQETCRPLGTCSTCSISGSEAKESSKQNGKWNQNRRWPRGYDLGGADFFA